MKKVTENGTLLVGDERVPIVSIQQIHPSRIRVLARRTGAFPEGGGSIQVLDCYDDVVLGPEYDKTGKPVIIPPASDPVDVLAITYNVDGQEPVGQNGEVLTVDRLRVLESPNSRTIDTYIYGMKVAPPDWEPVATIHDRAVARGSEA